MRPSIEDQLASVEQHLLDCVLRLAKFPEGRRAVILHLSRLRPGNRRDHHIRIAGNTFETLVKQFDGQLFILSTGDIAFICRDVSVVALDQAVTRVRYLFNDDPLATELDDEPSRFASWYDLGEQYDEFLELVRGLHAEEQKRRKRLMAIATPGGGSVRTPLTPKSLGELTDAISRADLSSMVRRQPVYVMLPHGAPKAVFREIYISIAELGAAIMPRHDLAADRWLFHYLTLSLDRRMLALLKRSDERRTTNGAFSLNLNVETLLSPEFLAFDASLGSGSRAGIVIELQKTDIYADLGAYLFARDFLRERGYRVCLDGVSDLMLPFVDREKLGLDLVKIYWSSDLADEGRAERVKELRRSLERIGKLRVVLAHCDSDEAIDFGQSLGIAMFQGWGVDRRTASSTAPQRARHQT